MPCGRTRSVGSGEPPGTRTVPPSGPSSAPSGSWSRSSSSSSSALTGPGPLLRLQRGQGTAGLVAPGLLALQLARLAGPRLGRASAPRRAPSGPRSAMSPATNGASAGCGPAAPRRVARRTVHPAGCRPSHPPRRARGSPISRPEPPRDCAPAARRTRPVAGPEAGATLGLPVAAAVRALAAPAGLHPPRRAGTDQPGEPLGARAARAATAAAGPGCDGRPPRRASGAPGRPGRRAASRRWCRPRRRGRRRARGPGSRRSRRRSAAPCARGRSSGSAGGAPPRRRG